MRPFWKKLRICLIAGVCAAGMFYQGGKLQAAVNQKDTDINPVTVDSTVAIADTEKYKDMDYSFLKYFSFGTAMETTESYITVAKMQEDTKLKAGQTVRTEGYYRQGDGGAACYLIASRMETGGIELANGLYANIQVDSYTDAEGTNWAVASIDQFGATGDGKTEDQDAINNAIKSVGFFVNENSSTKDKYDRGLVYMPSGEYKCGNMIHVDYSNLNLIGEGDNTILFTDNDYRDEEGYSEFFFENWGANHVFYGMFRVEAREVDLYHYMRQFVIIYSQNVYVYQVDLIVPQSSYSSYYFEDKQYSNFCCYSGNRYVTVDDCTMEQMSGTYRGANLGILDIWAAGEENITVMNCDFYGNARDEQFGFFSKNDENASVKHVNFINNTIHSVQIKYPEIIGTRTMCFTIAYTDSQNVEDIRVAGNHFICETDSKFMTFGNVKNCVIEDNIIEVKCTYQTWSIVFDSDNLDKNNILVKNNQFFLTSDYGLGKGNLTGGNLTLKNNRIFSDVVLAFGVLGTEIHGNEIIFLENMSKLSTNANCTGNKVYLYKGLGSVNFNKKQIANYGGDADGVYQFNNNEIYDYQRADKLSIFQSLIMLDGDLKSLDVSNNKFYMPNTRFLSSEFSGSEKYQDFLGTYFKNNIFRQRSGNYGKITVKNNTFQSTEIPESDSVFSYSGNIGLEPAEDLTEELCSSVKILYKGEEAEELVVTEDSIDLDDVEYVAVTTDEDGKVTEEKEIFGKDIRWYTSVESMATVSEQGTVTRKIYGDVCVYAVPLDGSGVYGKCVIHFVKKAAREISLVKTDIELQPGLKYYIEYAVLPEGANQEIIWNSLNEKVATVNKNGMITAVADGTTTIVGTSPENPDIKQSIQVKVSALTVKKIELNNSLLEFKHRDIGATKQLSVSTYIPNNATNAGVKKWESSDESVATVDSNGLVKIVGSGKVTISAYSMDMTCKGSCNIYVCFPQVSGLKVTEYTNDKVTLSWEEMKGADGYYIYQWDTSASDWRVLNGGNPKTDTSFDISNLTANTSYTFCVRAYNAGWETGVRIAHEGEDTKETVKTLSYIPVTSLKSSTECISLPKGKTDNYIFTYSPSTANYGNLKVSFEMADNMTAAIEEMKETEAGKHTVSIKGLNYGVTKLSYTVDDEWRNKLEIPIGVVTEKMIPSTEENVTVTASAIKTTVSFRGFKNEKELLEEGSITGYMVQRTQTVEFHNLEYIKAEGSDVYTVEDNDIEPGKTYDYTITPCYKDGDHYFLGYNNGHYKVTIPVSVLAESVKATEKIYTVAAGKTKEISAKVSPKEASIKTLTWNSDNDFVASVKRSIKEQAVMGMDYAIVSGNQVGAATITMTTTDDTELSGTTTVIVTPEKVNNVQTAATTDSIGLLWDTVDFVSGYQVYRQEQGTATWTLLSKVTDNSYVDNSIVESKLYRYKILPYYTYEDKDYEGEQSDVVVATSKQKDEANSTIIVEGYNGEYDGKEHEALQLSGVNSNDTVAYSEDASSWFRYVPKVTNVSDSKIIYIAITREGKTSYFSVVANVSAIPIENTDIQLVKDKANWTGTQQTPKVKVPTEIPLDAYTITYQGNFTDVGTHKVFVMGSGNYKDMKELNYVIELQKGKTYTKSGYKYKVTTNNKVTMVGATSKQKTSITIPDKVSLGGRSMTITAIGDKAFQNYKKLTKVKIGRYVTSIGTNGFAGDKKLKSITFTGDSLTKIGNSVWKNIYKKAVFNMPKKKKKAYKKLLTKKTGYVSSMKIKVN